MSASRRALFATLLGLLGGCSAASLDLGGNTAGFDGGTGAGIFTLLELGPETAMARPAAHPYAWGMDDVGQLPVDVGTIGGELCGGLPCRSIPATSPPLENATDVAAGRGFTCILDGGSLGCIGQNLYGTLGRGVADADAHPTLLPTNDVGTLVHVAAGDRHACAVAATGHVFCMGYGGNGQLGLAPSTLETCGTVDSQARADELGLAPGAPIPCSTSLVEVPGITDAFDVIASPFGTCALRRNGKARCFGRNDVGQLGLSPVQATVSTPTDLRIGAFTSLAIGETHGCFVDGASHLACFGSNALGQLGVGSRILPDCGGTCSTAPQTLVDLVSVHRVAVGRSHTCATLLDGTARCFGSDAVGQLGNSSQPVGACGAVPCATQPVVVYGLSMADAIVARDDVTCVVEGGSTLECWGDCTTTQCGLQPRKVEDFPAQVYGLSP